MIIHWFRRDLRLADNTALAAAAGAGGGGVLPLFILDDAILRGRWASANRAAFLLACLRELDHELRALGSRLIVRRGEPLAVLLDLAREVGARGVFWNRDYTPYAIRRDTAVKQALRDRGLDARSHKDAVIFEMDEVRSQTGTPYTVYTPYARAWRRRLADEGFRLSPTPQLAPLSPDIPSLPIPDLDDLGLRTTITLPGAGAATARRQLRGFVETELAGYAEQRNLPALAGTSRLSPHLRLGTLSARQCLAALAGYADHRQAEGRAEGEPFGPADLAALPPGPDTWLGELIWRDFYVQILYHHPRVLRGAFRREYDGLAWENRREWFDAWREGRTGYPIVDAAMRQLAQEGWMHNRARMIVASFLTKDLLIDWRWGEGHFMQLLIDGDPAANNGGWQWAAGTGTDAQPYFRIFNPASQGEKFDPEGAYVRRYLPELANVPNRHIHAPHLMAPAEQIRADLRVGRDYPAPIVDHKLQRERALALYGNVKKPKAES